MSNRTRVFLDVSVMQHSIRSRTVLRKRPRPGLGGHDLFEIIQEDPTSRKREEPLRTEIDSLSRVAELARRGEIELLFHSETIVELLGNLKFPGPGSSELAAAGVTKVKGPVEYSRFITPFPPSPLSGKTWRTMQIDFLKSLDHPRFLQLQRACGAYQGDHVNESQLVDAFHVWCAEEAGATHFLTNDFDLIDLVKKHKRWPPRVRVLAPSELLSEVAKAGGDNMSDEIEPTGQASRVVEYLKAEFPGQTAKVFEERMRFALVFRIGTGEMRRLLLVSQEILDDTPEDKMDDLLRRLDVARALEAIGKDVALVVTSKGMDSLPIGDL